MTRKFTVTTSSGDYAISVGSGLVKSLSRDLVSLFGKERKALYIVTSPEIWSLWGARLLEFLVPFQPIVLFVPSGERYKRLGEIERLSAEMAGSGADRSSVLIAFGGGVIGDMAGFLAAIYMRGIDYVQLPTTLLAQVDSSVGGKTGVNLSVGKNLIGSFHQPRAVFADIDLLSTLSERELRAGLYESIKAGLISDAGLFRFIEANGPLIDQRDPRTLERIVSRSVRMKAQVVGQDEKESGLRMILNFGHTIGHAIESVTGFRAVLHGEAIAWGMLIALTISRRRNWLKQRDAERAERVIRSFDPPRLPPIDANALLEAASRDKKNRAGARRFVLLKGIGTAVVTEDVTDAEVTAAIDSTLSTRPPSVREARDGQAPTKAPARPPRRRS